MACSNCNTPSCGCSGTYVVSQTCPPACSEVFNSSCIVYTGVDLTCENTLTGLTSTVISRNDYLDSALTKIVQFFCARVNEALSSTVITTNSAPYLTVTPPVAGSGNQLYVVDLDIAEITAAVDGNVTVVEAGGTNVTVNSSTVPGSPSVTTYTVTAQGTDVVSGDDFIGVQITQNQDDDIATLTLNIAEVDAALGDVIVEEGSTGHVIVTTLPDHPTTGDTTYRLDSISTDVVSTDPILTVVQSGGIAPDYDQVFTLDLDDALLSQAVMNTLNQTGGLGSIGLQEGTGIALNYDPATYTMVISSTVTDPVRWLSLIDDFGAFLDPSLPTSSLAFLGDGGLVSGGFDGISATLNANPAAAELQLINTDPGSAQLTFLNVDCSNVSGVAGGTCTAGVNQDTLEIVGGSDIDLTVTGNEIRIDNMIDRVYSEIQSDGGDTLQAPNTTSTFTVAGGTGISTAGDLASQTITITNDGITSIVPNTGITAITDASGACTVTNTSPASSVALASAGGTSLVSDGVGPQLEILGLTAGGGIGLSSTATEVTINAEVRKKSFSFASGAPGWFFTYNHALATESVSVVVSSDDTPFPQTVYVHGTDYNLEFVDANQIKVTDIGGGLSATNVRVLVIG